jgi:SAM-dependent methyltransferase
MAVNFIRELTSMAWKNLKQNSLEEALVVISVCPACLGKQVSAHGGLVSHYLCSLCGHCWSGARLHQQYYAQLSGRNTTSDPDYDKKMMDRLNDLEPLLHDGMRVLEIGCAEGSLGRRIKDIAKVEYVGIELSEDALTARKFLDRVSRDSAAVLHDEPYDLILSFHVLEHVSDIRAEVSHWHRLMKPSGTLVVEVPNEAGHPLLSWDANAEHLHQFKAASLSALLDHAGFAIKRLSTGHFESTVYSDSLRVLAAARTHAQARHIDLISRFLSTFPGPFVVYGIGGDFSNYVAPLLAELAVAALVDSDFARHGQRIASHTIQAFEYAKFTGLPVLVTSLRYKAEITAALKKQGVPSDAIFGLDSIFG